MRSHLVLLCLAASALPSVVSAQYSVTTISTNPAATDTWRTFDNRSSTGTNIDSNPFGPGNETRLTFTNVPNPFSPAPSGSLTALNFLNSTGSSKSSMALTLSSPIAFNTTSGFSGSYSWLNFMASTAAQSVPAFRLTLSIAGGVQPGGTIQFVYEPAYNGNGTASGWQTNSFTQTSGIFWIRDSRPGFAGNVDVFSNTINDWFNNNSAAPNGVNYSQLLAQGATITGFQVSIGSGAVNSSTFLDGLQLTLGGGPVGSGFGIDTNFRFNGVPEPGTVVAGAMAALLAGWTWRRRGSTSTAGVTKPV